MKYLFKLLFLVVNHWVSSVFNGLRSLFKANSYSGSDGLGLSWAQSELWLRIKAPAEKEPNPNADVPTVVNWDAPGLQADDSAGPVSMS